jgi:hypothetical protein
VVSVTCGDRRDLARRLEYFCINLNLGKMDKKLSKRRKQIRVVSQPVEAVPPCPCCGITPGEKFALSLMDQLYESHAELSAALRLAGRQMLRFELHGHESLEKIRKVLRRADNIREALESSDEALLAAKPQFELKVNAPTLVEYSGEQILSAGPIRKSTQRRKEPIGPQLQRIFRIPD